MTRLLARTLVALLLLAGPVATAQTQPNVMGSWRGSFTWDTEPDEPQTIEVEFIGETSGPNGTRRFLGRGVYRTSRVTAIEVTLDLDPNTRAISMTESAPDAPADFVTDGAHLGTLSADFSRIEARWSSKSQPESGRLVLVRVGTK